MTLDVNKIIEESVKDIIDPDKDDVLKENKQILKDNDDKGNVEEDGFDEKEFNETRDFLKDFVKGSEKKS